MLRRNPRLVVAFAAAVGLALAGCSSGSTSSASSGASTTAAPVGTGSSVAGGTASRSTAGGGTATTRAAGKLKVLVTNDDGVAAPGIDAVVEGLRQRGDLEVVVVAPKDNRSGTGPKKTDGPLTVTDATTASGYPAKAVDGYPADTIVWAVEDGNVAGRPDLVVSGNNAGQNLGPFTKISGTVGAATEAASLGIPALAVSQGLAGDKADYGAGVKLMNDWIDEHKAAIGAGSVPPLWNLNVPTCTTGSVRGVKEAKVATDAKGRDILKSDCSGATQPAGDEDIDVFNAGYAALSELPVNG